MTIPVRCLRRDRDSQLRAQWMPHVGEAGALELRVWLKSPSETEHHDAFMPTSAVVVVPRVLVADLAALLAELASEIAKVAP